MSRMNIRTLFALSCIGLLPLLLSSCVTTVTDSTPVLQEAADFPEQALLDVTILPFASRYARTKERADGLAAYRWMEGFFAAQTTALTLQQTAGFGAVRLDFKVQPGSELIISGRMVYSDPRRLIVSISVDDATGSHWYSHQYLQELSQEAYLAAEAPGTEPFQNLYNNIANDLLTYRQSLTAEKIRSIRLTAAMLFAREFSPEAFNEYVQQGAGGPMRVKRLPPENDPVFQQLRPITQYHQQFLQARQAQVEQFYAGIAEPYFNLRKNFWDLSSNLADNLDQYIQGGATRRYYSDTTSNRGRRWILRDLERMAIVQNMQQFSVDLEPLVITMGNRVVTLNSNVEDQYEEWRDILKQLYLLDRGLAESPFPVPEEVDARAP